ncbi:MAG: PDZ domain-containing protein, partial [bacterium]
GLGFSIPINNARRAIDQFIETGEVEYGWLGVSIPDTPEEVLSELGLSRTLGAMIHNVFRGSPAWEYGMLPGDYVTGINGGRVRTPEELTLLVGDLIAGEEAEFEVIRLGERMTITVTVGRRDDDSTVLSAQGNLWPGLRIQSLTDAVRRSFSISPDDSGIVIAAVESRTPAAEAGLRRGDVITAVNGTDTSDATDFYRALGEGSRRSLQIDYIRNGEQRQATING